MKDIDVDKVREGLKWIQDQVFLCNPEWNRRLAEMFAALEPKPEAAKEPWGAEDLRAWLRDQKAEAIKWAKYPRAAALRDCLERLPEPSERSAPPEPSGPYRVQPTAAGYWQVLDAADILVFQTRHEGLALDFAAAPTLELRLDAAEKLLRVLRGALLGWLDRSERVADIDRYFKDTGA